MKPVILFFLFLLLYVSNAIGQTNDTLPVSRKPVPVATPLNAVLDENFLLNSKAKPVAVFQKERARQKIEPVFYFIAVLFLFLGILRVSFDRYFTNLLRVFFNTSLRQSQLTDQLLQARLPSLFFNIFFVIIGGLYLFLLLIHFGKVHYPGWQVLSWCIAAVLVIYAVKFAVIHLAGWLTDYKKEAESYVFIVFLINKMIALVLVPLVLFIAFSGTGISRVAVIVSFIVTALMFLLRFFRSYGLLQHRLKVSRLHFLLYIIGIELLPILLIYKAGLLILSKSL